MNRSDVEIMVGTAVPIVCQTLQEMLEQRGYRWLSGGCAASVRLGKTKKVSTASRSASSLESSANSTRLRSQMDMKESNGEQDTPDLSSVSSTSSPSDSEESDSDVRDAGSVIEGVGQMAVWLLERPDKERVAVFPETVSPKYNVKHYRTTVSVMTEMKCNHAIIVYDGITPPTKKSMLEARGIGLFIESFLESELRYNPTKHILVPEHHRLKPKAARKFLDKYGVLWPILLTTDVIARFYGYGVGDVIRVTRRDGSVVFRIVRKPR